MNYPIFSRELAWQEVASQVVIIELAGKRLFHQLNDIGSHIWKMCDGSHSIEEICDSIYVNYNIDEETAKNDSVMFLEDLMNKGLIQWKKN